MRDSLISHLAQVMISNSIVKDSTKVARRTVFLAVVGAVAIIATILFVQANFGRIERAAVAHLIAAHQTANRIKLAAERLTMSANMAAATGNERWIERYEENIPLIAKAIRRAMQLAPPSVAKEFDGKTRISNDRLLELERRSFEAARAGDAKAALRLFDSRHYVHNKQISHDGTRTFINDTIAAVRSKLAAIKKRTLIATGSILAVGMMSAILLWRQFTTSLSRSESAFTEAENEIRRLAMSDELTGIANRRALYDALQRALARAERSRTKVAALMIDLDRFKPVNDQYGHTTGDLVLKEVAKRLDDVLRGGELLARVGGDEFIAIVGYSGENEAASHVGHRMIERLSEPMNLDGLQVQIGASIGIAIYPSDATTDNDLLRRADLALYRAKQGGRGALCFFERTMEIDGDEQLRPERELRQAV